MARDRLIERRSARLVWQMIVQEFRRKRQTVPRVEELKNQLHADINHATALELLRRLQESDPDESNPGGLQFPDAPA